MFGCNTRDKTGGWVWRNKERGKKVCPENILKQNVSCVVTMHSQ